MYAGHRKAHREGVGARKKEKTSVKELLQLDRRGRTRPMDSSVICYRSKKLKPGRGVVATWSSSDEISRIRMVSSYT